MTEDASAGRLYLEVVADTTGLRSDIRTKVEAATRNVKAKIEVELDAARLRAEAKAAAALAKVTAKVEFDRAQIRRELATKVAQAARDVKAKVAVEVDDATARAKVAAVARGAKATITADADTTTAEAQVEAMRRRQAARPVRVNVEANSSPLTALGRKLSAIGGLVTSISKFVAISSGILVAAGALTNLAGAGFAAVASLSQVVGVLAAIPNLAGVAVQGIGALIIGFTGIGDAVKAMGKSQAAAGRTASQSAATQAASAEQIRAAHERVARAQESAAERVAEARERLARVQESAAERSSETEARLVEVQVQGARRIRDAQAQAADAHQATRRALEELSAATQDAIQHAKDLELQLSGAALDEEGAQLALERAKRKLTDITSVASQASGFDRREADLEYRQAVQRLKEVQARNQQLAKEKASLDENGIQSAAAVVAAQRRVDDARADEADAQLKLRELSVDVAHDIAKAQADLTKTQRDGARDVIDAQRDLSKVQRDAARDVIDAQRGLAQAMRTGRAGAAGQTASYNALAAAMDKLSPAGRRFARFLSGVLLPRFRRLRNAVQESLLPPLQEAITRSMPLLDTLQDGLIDAGKRVGDLSGEFAALVASKAFRGDVKTIMASNNRALTDFGKAGIALTSALRHVAVVAGKTLVEPFAKWVLKLSESADAAARTGRETGKMARFFERAKRAASLTIRILKGLGKALLNLGKAARPSGDTLLERWAAGAEHLAEVTADPQVQQRLRRFFEKSLPVAEKFADLMERILDIFGRLGEITGGDALDGLFWVLNRFLDLLELITKIPGGGTVLSTLLLLSGVGLGLGLVAKAVGSIAKNIGRIGKFTGVGKLLDKLNVSKGRKTGVGALADDVDTLTDAIDRELPKDKRKSHAVGDIGSKAHDTSGKAKDLGKKVDDLGDKATTGARKSRKLSGALKRVGGVAATTFGAISDLVGVLPGLDVAAGGKGKKADGADVAAGGGGESKPKKGGRVKKALIGTAKGGGVAAGILALLFGEDIANAISGGEIGTPRGAAGGAVGGGIAGGGLGSFFGPIGTIIGTAFGSAFGAVSGGGGDMGRAGVGALFGVPGVLVGGFTEQIKPKLDSALRELLGFRKDGTKIVNRTWSDILRGAAILGPLPAAISKITGKTKDRFSELKTQAPLILSQAWRGALSGVPILGPIVTGVGGILGGVKNKFGDLKLHVPDVLSKTWRAAIGGVPGLGPIVTGVGGILAAVKGKFGDLKIEAPRITSQGWSAVKTGAVTGLAGLPPAVGRFTGAIPALFKAAVEGSRTNFAKLQPATASPVKWVADRVFDGGVAAVWNAVASRLPGLPPLPLLHLRFAGGGITPGYTPGRDVHRYFSPTGGVLDLSGGEGIMRPELTRVLGADFVHGGNAAARKGGVPGVIRWLAGVGDPGGLGFQGFADGGIFGGVSAFVSAAKDFFPQGIASLIRGAVSPLIAAARAAIGTNPWGNAVVGAARAVADKVVDYLVTKDGEVGGPGRKAVRAARSQIGVPYSWGGGGPAGPSYGFAQGAGIRGFDCSSLMQYAWFKAIGKVMPRTTFTQKPWLRPITGRPREGDIGQPNPGHTFMYSGAGKVIEAPFTGSFVREVSERPAWWGRPPAAFLADSGAVLPPGRSIVDNLTGRNEWILTPEAVRMLGGEKAVAALNRAAGAAGLYRSSRAALAGASATSRAPAAPGREGPLVEQHIYAAPGQSEHEIAMISNRKLGVALG